VTAGCNLANVVDVCGQGIAISTDGIGSKAMIAWNLRKFETVGIDCVAMNVNDVICVGAKPITMVDYIAIERVDADILEAIGEGLAAGAEMAGISISGGETAQLKDMVNGFDLAGTAIGHVDLDKILIGQDIQDGDLQRIPVKLTHSRHVGSSCGILYEKVSVRKHRRAGIEYERSARKTSADRL
jgi:phosphoribosylformylglycinamidine cyclo-ligase